MAKDKKNKDNKPTKKQYTSPLKTVWGKVLVVFLSLLMVAGILASFIYLIIKSIQNV